MPRYGDVSASVIRRLPRYRRFLGELLKKGVSRISSRELAGMMNLTASQIRQDLNCFGGFGQQGYGYNVDALHREIGKILGLDNHFNAVLVGVGNLGRAIASHITFESKGFALVGAFDSDPGVVGQRIKGIVIRSALEIEDFCAQHHPDIAILCVPPLSAAEVVRVLDRCGIQGYWNFSHYDIKRDFPHVAAENVHLGDTLMTLCYQVSEIEAD